MSDLLQRFAAQELPDDPLKRPLADVAVLLQQMKSARDDLTAERERGRRAEDEIWAGCALLLSRLLRTASASDPTVELSSIRGNIEEFFRAHRLEIVSATCEDVDSLEPGRFEVMSVAETADPREHNTVLETFEPAVLRDGRQIHRGRLIVAKFSEDPESVAQSGS